MEKRQLVSMIHFLVKREDELTNKARVEPNLFWYEYLSLHKRALQRGNR